MNAYKELLGHIESHVDLLEWLEKVNWAYITCRDKHLQLKPIRTKEDEEAFLEGLKSIDYDNGYGGQELFGIVAYKDGDWLSRYEYDGAECWQYNKYPEEPDWDELKENFEKELESLRKYEERSIWRRLSIK